MKSILVITLLSLIVVIPSTAQHNCPEGINLIPKYGSKKKCAEQLQSDSDFITDCLKQFSDRKTAAHYFVRKGWEYFYKNDPETAMKRFNQAWLLDSLNAETFWGFGNLIGMKSSFEESIKLLEHSIALDPNNSSVYESLAVSLGQLFYKTKNIEYLNKMTNALKKSLSINPKNVRALGQLTAAYSYFVQKDSAVKYLKLTDQLDPAAVDPEVRKLILKR